MGCSKYTSSANDRSRDVVLRTYGSILVPGKFRGGRKWFCLAQTLPLTQPGPLARSRTLRGLVATTPGPNPFYGIGGFECPMIWFQKYMPPEVHARIIPFWEFLASRAEAKNVDSSMDSQHSPYGRIRVQNTIKLTQRESKHYLWHSCRYTPSSAVHEGGCLNTSFSPTAIFKSS